MNDGDLARFGTGTFAVFGQLQQRAYLVEREAQLPSPADKAEPHEMAMTIEPVTAFAARRQGKQADLLIISDRFDVAPRALRHDADWQPRRGVLQIFPIHAEIPLEPVGTTGPI